MSFLASIADISMWLFGLILMVSQLIAHAIGFQLGARQRKRQDSNLESVGAVVGGMLGLLAFVLALTLSFANERFSERRAGTLAESNAIGTAWLRATAVGGPHGEQIARLLDQYIVERADFVRAGRDIGKIDQINQRSNALQSRMWSEVTAIVREQPNPVSVSLMASVNDAFDAASVERFAFSLRMAPEMFWLLMALTLVSMAGLGYQLGVRGQAHAGAAADGDVDRRDRGHPRSRQRAAGRHPHRRLGLRMDPPEFCEPCKPVGGFALTRG